MSKIKEEYIKLMEQYISEGYSYEKAGELAYYNLKEYMTHMTTDNFKKHLKQDDKNG